MTSPTDSPPGAHGDLPGRLRADLGVALKQRDAVTVAVLRTALSAIANAEAPALDDLPAHLPGTGPSEHARLVLSPDQIEAIVRHEIADRRDTIEQYVGAGRPEPAEALQVEVAILERYVGATPDGGA